MAATHCAMALFADCSTAEPARHKDRADLKGKGTSLWIRRPEPQGSRAGKLGLMVAGPADARQDPACADFFVI
jgi:hypothetical protein